MVETSLATRSIVSVHVTLAARYSALINDYKKGDAYDPLASNPRLALSNIDWMCRELMQSASSMPVDKMARWLGFIQACLAMRGLIEVDDERDFTRPLFHSAYAAEGLPYQTTRVRTE